MAVPAARFRQPSGTPPSPDRARRTSGSITVNAAAASATVRACGPAVSCVCEIGTMPRRLTSPTVGLMPTSAVDAPTGRRSSRRSRCRRRRRARFAATAAPEPELDPHGLRSSAYGLFVCPPRPLQPLDECDERKFAHSLRFVLPRITAPAARRRATTNASCAARRRLERERAGRRHHAVGGVDVVLDQDRDAVQRTAQRPRLALGVERVARSPARRG